ncbi:MAG: superfamily II DNA/RNA helicase [Bacillariaceae sp.]|jgi:superfamily II DNA/RNA helicase
MISRRRQILQSLTISNTNYHSYRSYQRSAKILCSTSFVGIQVPSNHIRTALSLSPFSSWRLSLSPMSQRSASVSFLSTVAHNKEKRKKLTHSSYDDENRFHPSSRFEDLNLHPQTLKALRRQGLHRLTEIQEKTYDFILNGHNLVARSRTGTGKTLAFLVPSLERQLLREQQYNNNADTISTPIDNFNNNFRIPILILAPTRELAAQIHKEAEKLLSIHDNHRDRSSKLSAQVIYGGVSKEEDVRRFQSRLPTILVATPGRLKDHL